MINIEYNNISVGTSKRMFVVKYILNQLRTWWLFHYKYPWVKYVGFVRVMKRTSFARFDIRIGHNVQFGIDCKVAANVHFGNNILLAGRVSFVSKYDHEINVPCQLIWNGKRCDTGVIVIEDDVWFGNNVTVIGPVYIGKGSVIAAGAVVTKDIPPCEVWGGVPAKKIRDRFSDRDKKKHIEYIENVRCF